MERIPSAQPPPCLAKHPLEIADMQGMDFPMYMYKPRRGMKRADESKETYKLPHRLIEKKRRDRINECISQLKDLLPEHLKLTTLGHLEKAVVLELTLKHVKALGILLEQQQQKIIALQNGMQISDQSSVGSENSEEMFRFGFHRCAKEVVQYLSVQERDLTPAHMINHLHKMASEALERPSSGHEAVAPAPQSPEKPAWQPAAAPEGPARNCVPVIQRTYPHGNGEQSGSDTDTDSGYGGEHGEKRAPHGAAAGAYGKQGERTAGAIKQESDEPPPRAKRPRSDFSEDDGLSGGPGGYAGFPSHQSPLCMPFYLLPPSAAYLPLLDKCWYPGAVSVMYPGMSGGAEKHPQALLSPRPGSPAPPHHTPMDSPALLHALKQVPPLNLQTKD